LDPQAVGRLAAKARSVKGCDPSNTDNMRVVMAVSLALLHDEYVRRDGMGESEETPPNPLKVVDRIGTSPS